MAGFSRSGAMPHYTSARMVEGKAAGLRSAFPLTANVTFTIEAPQTAIGAALYITSDETGNCRVYPMERRGNRFAAELSMAELSERGGLYFYKYRVTTERGGFDLRKDPFDLSETFMKASEDRGDFRLLVYEEREVAPRRFYGGVMYQIFPDRFFSSGENVPRQGAELCRDRKAFPALFTERKKNDENRVFYGGDLRGIENKLPYLASLGVTCLYLNPIFLSPTSHRYDTSDYMTVDPFLGGEAALISLVRKAEEYGISILLDGVFNHTGDDSLYFNAKGSFPSVGAAQSKASPYADWYRFTDFPAKYEAWWGVPTLPRVMSDTPSYREYLFSKNGVLRHYMRLGIAGWRLDVADELSDSFLAELYRTVREERADALVIGEVWENAAEKISYGVRKKYLCGTEMDSVMNYPVRTAVLDYLTKGEYMPLYRTLSEIYGLYPPEAANTLMNILGTHDTPRVLTALGGVSEREVPYHKRSTCQMSDAKRQRAKKLLCLAVAVQMTLPGIPCIYYGDEAGMEGFGDPFCRMPYPWGEEDTALQALYRDFGRIRRENAVFADGELVLVFVDSELLCFERVGKEQKAVILVNRSENDFVFLADREAADLFSAKASERFALAPLGFAVLELPKDSEYSVFPLWKGSENE